MLLIVLQSLLVFLIICYPNKSNLKFIQSNGSWHLGSSKYFSERLFMETADLLVSEGYAKAGYNLISLDDCWLDKKRGSDGRLRPNPVRFPSGIRALADYVRRLSF